MHPIKHPITLMATALAASAFLAACGGGASAPLQDQAALVAVASPTTINTSGTSNLSTTGGSGTGAVSYAVTSGSCTISGSVLTAPAAAGSCTFTATKAADSSYKSATSAAATVTVIVPYTAVTVVRNQTSTQDSYVPDLINGVAPPNAATSLPGNNLTGNYAWGENGNDWWSGVGTDSVYRGIGTPAGGNAGVGVYVKGAGSTTWSINGASSISVGLGTNPECVGICKATIILKATDTCIATINSPMTILTTAVNTGNGATQVNGSVPVYTSNLTDSNWTVSGCTTNTMTAFKTGLPVKEVHAQLLQPNMQTTTPAGGPFPNGINLGAVKFQ